MSTDTYEHLNAQHRDPPILTARVFFGDSTDEERYWFLRNNKSEFPPEKRLLVAVLLDALDLVRDLTHRHQRTSHLYRQTRNWFLSSKTDYQFSFLNICLTLDLSPDVVLRRVKGYL
jgi:hypothetical protein